MAHGIVKTQIEHSTHYRETFNVFMYGSNLNPSRLKQRIPSWDGSYETAFLAKYELCFNMYAEKKRIGANIVPHPTRKVYGIIVQFNKAELTAMDSFEGYPYLYNRAEFELETRDKVVKKAYVYYAQSQWLTDGLTPDKEYLNCIIEGAYSCELPEKYIKAIKKLGES